MTNTITLDEFRSAYNEIKEFIKETPLINYEDTVYLKKESKQFSGSFKWSGVFYAVKCIFNKLLELDVIYENYYITTQSTGNHGIALIESVNTLVDIYTKKYPDKINLWKSIVTGIFTNKSIRKNKLQKMYSLLNKSKYNKNGFINNDSENYEESLKKRINFLKNNDGIYVEHGGRDIMIGYGAIAFELDKQLPKNKSVGLYVAVGAGGIIGIGLCLSLLRETKLITIQTYEFNAFNKSLENGIILNNDNNYTNVNISDGIAVDRPEEYAFNIGRELVFKSLNVYSYEVINLHLKTKLSGSTCIALSGLKKYKLDNVDYNIVIDCEGNWS